MAIQHKFSGPMHLVFLISTDRSFRRNCKIILKTNETTKTSYSPKSLNCCVSVYSKIIWDWLNHWFLISQSELRHFGTQKVLKVALKRDVVFQKMLTKTANSKLTSRLQQLWK